MYQHSHTKPAKNSRNNRINGVSKWILANVLTSNRPDDIMLEYSRHLKLHIKKTWEDASVNFNKFTAWVKENYECK